MKSKVKYTGYKYALDADAAFRRGNRERAKQYGDLAIAKTAGLQRYMLMKSLERQERNPERESYFYRFSLELDMPKSILMVNGNDNA